MFKNKNKVTNTTKQVREEPIMGLVLGTPKGIEASEACGQAELCQSAVLPVKWFGGTREDLEQFGVAFGSVSEEDTIFQHVTFPSGWSIQKTDHSMWTKLVDDKDRIRANIFYKAAFYDRSAHISLTHRFSHTPYENDVRAVVKDGEKVIWESEPFELGDDSKPTYESRDVRNKEAGEYLDATYPDWKDVTAYWDG